HSRGEPPLCGSGFPLMINPTGTKKLVPKLRSLNSMIAATNRMPNASRIRIAVTNHAQQGGGMRIQCMPGARFLTVVATKFTAAISEPTQKRPMLTSHRSVPGPCPGPAAANALRGGYCVHPASEAPPGTKNAETKTKNETSVAQNPNMLSLGKVISDAPSCSGRK